MDTDKYQIHNEEQVLVQVVAEDSAIHQYIYTADPAFASSSRFKLHLRLTTEALPNHYGNRDLNTTLLIFCVGNGGSAPSYISSIGLEALIDGEPRTVVCEVSSRSFPTNQNLKEEDPLPSGQGRVYFVHAPTLSARLQECGETIVLKEAYVEDEIGNRYSIEISPDLSLWLLRFPRVKRYPYPYSLF